jgi:hypothetical protein
MILFKVIFILFFLSLSNPLYAYVDPGFLSIIISALIGLFASLWFSIKIYGRKIIEIFKKKINHKDKSNNKVDL